DEVGELAGLDRTDVLLQTNCLGAEQCCSAQRFVRSHAARLQVPNLPVAAQTLKLSVTAQANATTGVNDVGATLGESRVAVLTRQEPLAATLDHRVQQLVRYEPAHLWVAMHV